MPMAAPRPCTHVGCTALVSDGSGRCELHPRPQWNKTAQTVKRITGRKLQAMRAQLFKEQPLCAHCLPKGFITQATQRDHIKPLAEGGTDTPDNVQALCAACHQVKSSAEAARGQQRGVSKP